MIKMGNMPKLSDVDVFAVPSFIFDIKGTEKKDLITRYRGTVVEKTGEGYKIASWQKSMYRYGGLYREVPIAINVVLDSDRLIKDVRIDERSYGSQGVSCDFRFLEDNLRNNLADKPFEKFTDVYKDSATTGCLHAFEILTGASTFFTHLREKSLESGSEQEILRVTPDDGGIHISLRHEVLDQTSDTAIDLRYLAPATFGKRGLPETLKAELQISYNGREIVSTEIKADDFTQCYGQLNRAYTRLYHAEKKYFSVKGKMSFSVIQALVGQTVLALSHEGMSGTVTRAKKLEDILIFLQTGEGREGCIGFQKGLNMNQQVLVKGIAAAAAVIAAAALGITIKLKIK